MERYFCSKCGNSYRFLSESNNLYKQCHICGYKEKAEVEDYRIYTEDYKNKGESFTHYFGAISKDITFPLVEKDGKLYTMYVEEHTLKPYYISQDDNKVIV